MRVFILLLLRPRRKWPNGHAASQRYEIPASHGVIHSSARASFRQPRFAKALNQQLRV